MQRIPLAVILLLAALLPVSPAPAATLKFATLAPEGSSWMQAMRHAAEQARARTGGRVRMKFYPGGVMGNNRSVLRKIRIGQLQGGAFPAGELSSVYSDAQIYSMPYLFHSLDEAAYVRRQLDDRLRKGFEANGLVVLGISGGGFAYLMSREPLNDIEALKERKVWNPEGDRIGLALMKETGVAPVSLPLSDVYTGLQTGLVDTVAASPTGAIAFQWHTRLRHLADVPLFYLTGLLVVDKRAFGRLRADDQAAVKQVVEEEFRRLEQIGREDNQEALAALRGQGIVFDHPDPGELSRWREIADRTIERLRRQGVYSEAMMNSLLAYLQEYRSRSAQRQ
jgi:TRAP-type C4-dicarboxylate transport system substrate-binding protein